MKILIALFFSLFAIAVFGQNPPIDGAYERTLHQDKSILEYNFIQEKNVVWEKRIWRLIDLQQKQNEVFRNEKEPLIAVLLEGLSDSTIRAYRPINDNFEELMPWQEILQWGGGGDTSIFWEMYCFDLLMSDDTARYRMDCLAPPRITAAQQQAVKKYRLKESWFLDEETGQLNVRILGIAPIAVRYDENGNYLTEYPLFWLYYPHIRGFLAKHEVFNSANDSVRLTWEDVFEARLFSSYITKESNLQNRRIQDCKIGVDALLESERIDSKIRNIEGDLFQD